MNTVGKNLKALRKKKCWTQTKIAEKLNLSVPAYAKIESGFTILTISRVHEFVSLFEVPVNVILCIEVKDEETENSIILEGLRNKIAGIDNAINKLRGTAIELYGVLGEKRNF